MSANYKQEQIDIRAALNYLKEHKHDIRYFVVDDVIGVSEGGNISIDATKTALLNAVGNNNIGIGYDAGRNITTGYSNIFLGLRAGFTPAASGFSPNLSGNSNVCIGDGTGTKITAGSSNVVIGDSAGGALTEGHNNILYGHHTGNLISTGHYNIAMGYWALNTATGSSPLTGNHSIAMGYYALAGVGTTSNNNIALGYRAGTYDDATLTTRALLRDNIICLGQDAYTTDSGQIQIGNSTYITDAFTAAAFSLRSDERYKDFFDMDLGLDFINALEVKKYKWKEGADTESIHYGFSAQQVKKTLKEYVGNDKRSMHKIRGGEDGEQNLTYTEFVAPLVKAVQELSEINKELLHRIEILEG